MMTQNQEEWAKRKHRANAARRSAYALKNQDATRLRLQERAKRWEAEKERWEAGRAEREERRRLRKLSRGQVRRAYRESARKSARRLLVGLKRKPCLDCGGIFHPEAMEFDHRGGETKICDVSQSIKWGISSVLREAAKCDLVCANCHRARTARRRLGLPASLPPPDYEI